MTRLFLSACALALVLAGVWFGTAGAQGSFPINGAFDSSAFGWSFFSGASFLSGSLCYGGSGGCARVPANAYLISSCFIPADGTGFSYRHRSESGLANLSVYQVFFDYPSGGMPLKSSHTTSTSFATYYGDISGSGSGHRSALYFLSSGMGIVNIIDSVLVNAAIQCDFPYGVNTPIPIDWTNFPTPVPYPTFPAFPTAISNITNNTTNNTTNSGTVNNSYSVSGTFQVVNEFPYGAGTPIPIVNPTPQMTRIASRGDLVSVGGLSRSFSTFGGSGVIPVDLNSGGSALSLSGVSVEERPLSICLPNEVTQILDLPQTCWTLSVWSLVTWKVAGIDLIPWFSVVLTALLIVFIIRQVQEK